MGGNPQPPRTPQSTPPPGTGGNLGTILGAIAIAIAVVALALNFVIPGPAGSRGAIGPQGPAGAQGPAGTSATSLWASISASATLLAGKGVTSVVEIGTDDGDYNVTFNQEVNNCAITSGIPVDVVSPYSVAGPVQGAPDNVIVLTYDVSGPTNLPVYVAVFC